MSGPNGHKRLVVMVKQPVAGNVKTRLGREIGVAQATSFYRHATSNMVHRLACESRWQTMLAVTPDHAVNARIFARNVARVPQREGDLGQRMGHIMSAVAQGPVVIIGSDCPAVAGRHINTAFQKLGSHDAVIGPALDGGYWLIGLKRFPRIPRIFANVRWSSPHTRDDTLANLAEARVAVLEPLSDVDTAADLTALGRLRGRRVLPVV